jgi:hypothetical protein
MAEQKQPEKGRKEELDAVRSKLRKLWAEDELSDKDIEKVTGGMRLDGCITISDSLNVC